MHYKVCPNCGAQSELPEQCTVCGIFYAKWLKAQLRTPVPPAEEKVTRGNPRRVKTNFSHGWLISPWTYVPETVNVFEFAARLGLLVGMTIWGWLLIQTDPRVTTGLFPELSFYSPIISTFVLVFHEAGHVLFSFFGRFMAVAGGTALQLIVPMSLMLAFVYRYQNPFGGAVAMWLLGYAFIDAGPYCFDAMDMQLLLLGGGTGQEVGGHDWNNLLRWTNSLHLHESIALFLDTTGELLIITSVLFGGWIARLQYRNLDLK